MPLKRPLKSLLVATTLVCLTATGGTAEPLPARLPEAFVYCEALVPGIGSDLRYATAHNFVGAPIDGYRRPRCILTRQAALALKEVQEELRPFGLGLKVFDASEWIPHMAEIRAVQGQRDGAGDVPLFVERDDGSRYLHGGL